jgi:membrane-bound lytic murein transglycosylase D
MKLTNPRGLTVRRFIEGSALDPESGLPGFLPRWLLQGSLFLLVPLFFVFQVERVEDSVAPALTELPVPVSVGATLPLHVNDRVERWVERFRSDQRPAFQTLLERQGAYDALIRGKLRDRGMPEELVYLAMMEGGFSPWAVSSASAVGLWQFMGPTAQQYGLRVDEWVDERRDPVKATDAALDYLLQLHDRFGSWYLAAAAYNAGPSRVERVLRRYAEGRRGAEEIYWEVLDHLPMETREYVPRLVAATILAEGAEAEGFDMKTRKPFEYDRVFVPGETPLSRIAKGLDVELGVLRALNPQLLRGVTPPDEVYAVRVPVGGSPQVVASLGRTSRLRRAD